MSVRKSLYYGGYIYIYIFFKGPFIVILAIFLSLPFRRICCSPFVSWVRSVASFLKVSQRSSLPLPSAKSVHFPEAGVLDDGVDAVVDISSWAQPSLSPRDNDHLSVSRAQSLRLRVLSSRIEELERELQAKKDERKSLLNSLDSPI